ncbi:MAG: hypothetical protein ACRD25_07350 [Terracidiphilus sp.]
MSGSISGYPIMQVTVSASDSTDEERLQAILVEIAGQHLTVSIYTQPGGRAHFVEGSSKSHLQWICDRLQDKYRLAINVGPFKATLVETVRDAVEAEGKYIRQIGGAGNYGHCWLRIEPNKFGEGHMFASAVRDDILPHKYVDSIRRGVEEAIQIATQPGRHLIDLKVTVIDGSCHAEDSNPTAFEAAGVLAFQNALKKSSTVLMEPVMAVEIDVPEYLTMAVESQIHEHRGRIERIDAGNGRSEIRAIVPLAELLLPDSQELGEFPAEFIGYEPVSDDASPGEDEAGVTAPKPNSPRYRKGSEAARLSAEEG